MCATFTPCYHVPQELDGHTVRIWHTAANAQWHIIRYDSAILIMRWRRQPCQLAMISIQVAAFFFTRNAYTG